MLEIIPNNGLALIGKKFSLFRKEMGGVAFGRKRGFPNNSRNIGAIRKRLASPGGFDRLSLRRSTPPAFAAAASG